MTDIEMLVGMLRVCGNPNKGCAECPMGEEDCPGYGEWECAAEALMQDAANVIERLMETDNER